MENKLDVLFTALEKQRADVLGEIRKVSHEQFNQRVNGKWSINQILGHLITAELLSVGYINKKINAINEVGNTGLVGEIKLWIFILSQRLPLKYKAPKNLGDQPKAYSNQAELEKDWEATRNNMKLLLERFSSTQLKKKIYRHPVMGLCSILHAVIFFREHIIHHHPQIKRLLAI